MSLIRRHARLPLIAVSCVVLGAAVSAVAGAGASTRAKAGHSAAAGPAGRARGVRGLRRLSARAVHGDVVVKSKTGFVTVTFDRGTVNSVNGRQLTMTEGTSKVSYKTLTLAIPSDALVRDNRKPAALSDLKAGQRVAVIQAPKRTLVIVHTPK